MSRIMWKNFLFLMAASSLFSTCAHAAPLDAMVLEGANSPFQLITVPETPDRVKLEATLSRGSLEETVRKSLDEGIEAQDDCGLRLFADAVSVSAVESALAVNVKMGYDFWLCSFAKVPKINGLSVSFEDVRIAKTKIYSGTFQTKFSAIPKLEGDRLIIDTVAGGATVDGGDRKIAEIFAKSNWSAIMQKAVSDTVGGEVGQPSVAAGWTKEIVMDDVRFIDSNADNIQIKVEGKK